MRTVGHKRESCQIGKGQAYRGTTVSVTNTGKTCQRWDSQSPHSHNKKPDRYPSSGLEDNYCRNPDGEPGVWCYTTDPETRWELCDVPYCGGSVKKISPRAGSLEGKTRITISGSGFPDQYAGNKVFLINKDGTHSVECDVDKQQSTAIAIVCDTRPAPEGEYNLRLYENDAPLPDEQHCSADDDLCKFEYEDGHTPYISGITPKSGPPGTVVDFRGKIFTSKYQNTAGGDADTIERAYVGNAICDLVDDTGELYGIQLDADSNWGNLKCQVKNKFIGSHNGSFVISGSRGRSQTTKETIQMSAQSELYGFQTHAEVLGVSPSGGSEGGGTRITIRGRFFNYTTGRTPPRVLVGGQPCEVVGTPTFDTIECITPAVPESPLPAWPGGRGARIEQWNNTNPWSTDDFALVTNYTSDRAGYWVRPVAEGFWWTEPVMDSYVTRTKAFFVPTATGLWQFYVKSDDRSNMYMSPDEDPAKRVRVAYCRQYRPHWTRHAEQRTEKMMLQEGKRYYMEVTHHEGGGGSNVYVAARYFDTDFTSGQTDNAWMEEQEIKTTSTVRNEVQIVTLSSWSTASARNEVQTVTISGGQNFKLTVGGATTGLLNSDNSAGTVQNALNVLPSIAPEQVRVSKSGNRYTVEFRSTQGTFPTIEVSLASGASVARTTEGKPSLATFTLMFGGAYSDPISNDADGPTVRSAILSMLSVKCVDAISNPSSSITKFFRDFESDPTSFQNGPRVPGDVACGRYALKRPYWIYHYHNAGEIPLQTYRYTCFAYKGGPSFSSKIFLRLNYNEGGLAKMWWPTYDVGLVNDQQWHYTCLNVYELVSNHITAGSNFRMSGMLLTGGHQIPSGEEEDFYIDNFYVGRIATVSNPDDVLSQSAPGPSLSGNVVSDVLVSKTAEESVYNITFVPYNCGHNFPLMEVRSATKSGNRNRKTYTFPSTGTSSQILIEREWGATPPITGTLDLSYKGASVTGIASDISASDLKAQLLTIGTGEVSVEREGSCSGYTWTVDWLLSGGDKPAIQVDGSGLSGEDAAAEVVESRDGGLFINPLGGDYVETVHDNPQVQVFINNVPSSCVGVCDFVWDDGATPTITSVSPTSGSASASTDLTITGSGFSTNTSLINVDIGGVACVVATATAEQITCSVQEGAGGTHAVQLTVGGKGRAKHVNQTFSFTYTATVSGITPTSGSLGGGSTLNITGHGFGDDYVPKIDGQPCEVTLRTYSVISCTTPARSTAGTVAVTVYQGDDLGTTLTSPTSFTYDAGQTPVITAFNTSVASVEGGTVVAITGTAFGEAAADDAVMIGEKAAEVLSYSDTEVVVRLPAMETGSYPVHLLVDGNGYADTSTNSIPDVDYRLSVTNVYPDRGSILGGTRVLIKGEGFSETADSNVVMFGNVPCEVESADATLIACVTGTAARTHEVTNDGTHPDYGQGYAWSESLVIASVGDKVRWKWEAPDLAQGVAYSVQQTASASSTDYDGTGFFSGPRIPKGVFEHTFTTPGQYFYSTAAVDSSGRIFMKGSVKVLSLEEQNREENLKLTVAGFEANYDVDSVAADPTDTRSCPGSVTSISGCTDAAPTSNSSADGFPFDFWSCVTPKITSISRSNGTVHDTITIRGSGFGSRTCENEVTIGGYTADCTRGEDDLFCNANPHDSDMDDPMPIGTYLPIALSVTNGGRALTEITRTQDRSFVLLSNIDSVTPAMGSLAGGTRVVITGNGFSSSTQVTVADQACNIVTVTYTKIVCKTSAHQSRKRSTSQNVAGQVTVSQSINGVTMQVACTSNCGYTYAVSATPTVTAVEPTQVSGAVNELRINGTLFGTEASNVTISVGSEECVITHIEDDFILCDLAAVQVGNNAFELHIDGKGNADSSVSTIESLAVIDSFTPTNGSTQGGMTLTITGNGFVDGDTTIMFGSLVCPITEISLLQVKCTVPAHAEGLENVVTTSNDVQYPVKQFEYLEDQTPVVDSIDTAVGSTGDTITLTGSKFGTDQGDIVVTIDNAGCGVTSLSDTEIQCSVGSHSAGEFPVVVRSESRGYAISNVNFTYQLRVDSASPTEGSFGGGQELTVTGAGFDPQLTVVTVCDRACVLVGQPDPSSLTCEVPANPDSSSGDEACSVEVSVNSESDSRASAFTYRGNLSPRVTNVSPSRGGTAGGTTVTIRGTGFSTTAGQNVVTIAGSACIIQSESATEIVCVTEAHNGTAKSKVRVEVGDQGVALQTNADFWYIDVWSSPYTWGGGPLPEAGDLVAVPKGMTLLLDVTTPLLKVLLIEGGELIFDEKDVELKAENILITGGGLLQVGTEEEPFQHKGIITLFGHVRSTELPLYGAKTLAVREGRLELHGRPTPVTWSRLSETAAAGATTLTLKDGVNWNVGDSIVIATTGDRHSQGQNEKREIRAISEDGRTLTLTEGVEYEHLAATSTFTAGGESVTVSYGAEVGLLTHNVVVRGNNNEDWNTEIEACEAGFDTGEFTTQTCFQGRFGDDIGSDMFGAQVMFHGPRKDEDLVAGHLSYVEFTNSGQAFRLGRYAIHWHINGVMRGSYVRGCSIHKSFNRAVNIHDTHEMLIEHNVFYNIMGGAMFLEDGVETGNIFQYNLGVMVISSTSLLNDDITPAAYWVTNPNNTHIHNVAAGGTHFGFWYRMHPHPDGPSFDSNIFPDHVPLGEFYNNTVHSQGWFGIWIFEDYFPTTDGTPAGDPLPADFRGLTAWNNEKGAEWVHCGAIRFSDSIIFNNEKAGFEAKFLLNVAWGDAMYRNSWIVGRADELASSNTYCTKKGIILPYGHRLTVSGLKFVNFDQPSCVAIAITTIDGTCGDWCGGFTYKFDNTLWNNSPSKGAFRWVHHGVYYDTDGTLTGTANSKIVPTNDALPPECTASAEFSTRPSSHPASICPTGVDFVRFAWKDASPSSLEGKDVAFTSPWGTVLSYFIDKRMTHKPGWMALLQLGTSHKKEYVDAEHLTNISYTGAFSEFANDQWINIYHNFTQKPDRFQVIPGVMKNASSRPVSYEDNDNGDWYFDTNIRRFTYILSGKDSADPAVTRPVQLRVYRCYYAQCIPPPDPNTLPPARERPEEFDLWSDPESWQGTEEGWGGNYGNGAYGLPQDGDDVKIPGGKWMVADTALPVMHKLFIYGVLEFDDGPDKDFTLTATYIIVQGGRLIIGWEDNPYQGQAKIILQGNHLTPDYPFPSVNAGSKVLACFGGCDLHGKNRNYPFTKLAQDVEVGATQLVTETFKIRAISDKTITLNASVAFHHLGSTYTLEDESTYTMAAEVGLLTRNVKVIGDDYGKLFKESFGARVMISKFATEEREYIGKCHFSYARITNTEFYRTGQEGWTDFFDARYSVAYMDTGTVDSIRPSYVRKNAFHNGFSVAVGVFGATGIEVDDNVIHHTVGQGINVWGTNNKIRNNLVALNIWTGDYNGRTEENNWKWDAGIEVQNGRGIVLQGNIVAGSEKAGYHIDGEPCTGNTAEAWSNNEVHGTLVGVWAFEDGFPPCVKVRGFYVWKAFDFGIYFQSDCNLEISDNTIADSRLGLFHFVIGPSALTHQVKDNWVHLEDSTFIGKSEGFDCDRDFPQLNPNPKPTYIRLPKMGRGYGSPGGAMVGTQVAMHSQSNNGVPTHPFAGNMAYPPLSGYMVINNVKFARYGNQCGREDVAIMTNPNQEDATFPTYTSGLSFPGTQEQYRVYYSRPSLGSINPSDCVDMPCDAKHIALIKDSDGSLLGTAGTVVPEQEWQWDGDRRYGIGDYRIPAPALSDADGNKLVVADVAPNKGALRDSSCTYKSAWQAYECHDIDYQMLIIESMDPDTESRRLSPVALLSEGYVSLYNGPMDHGWCVGYTCQLRISTFYTIVYSDKHHDIYFTGVNPQKLRLTLRLRDGEDKAIRVGIFYANPQRLDVYRGTSYVMPTNGENNADGQLILNAPTTAGQYMPAMNAASGTNYFDDEKKTLYITIRGSTSIDIVTMPVLKVAFGMPAITVDEFFENNLRQNLASFLGIPANKIRVVNVVREDSKRKKRAEGSMTVEVEITDPPAEDSSSSEETTEDTRQDLQQAPPLLLIALSDEIGYEVQSLAVVEPLPSTNSSDWEEAAEEAESGTSPVATAIQIPSRIVVHTQPGPRGEGAAFPTQPALQVFDGSGNLVTTLGASSSPWEVQATIRSGTGTDARAATTGDSVVFKDGWANFTDLAISHSGEGYILDFVIVRPASASRFNTSSVAVDVEERSLSGRVIGTDAMLEVNEEFTLSVAITDAFTKEDVQNIAWKGHTWQCTVELDPISTQDGGATFAGTKTATFDPATGRATFVGLSLNQYDRYHLRFHVTSTPGDHDFWINASPITVYPANHTSPVIENTARVTLTFDGSYLDAVVGKEDYLETSLWQKVVGERSDVLVSNFSFAEGSVITEFDVEGTNEGVNATLMDLYDQVKGGMTLDIGGSTLTARNNMVVDGSNYYGADGGPPAAPPSAFPVVPVVVVIVLLLLIIIAAAVFYFYRKKKQQQVAHVRNKVTDDVPLKPSPSSSRAGADAESGLGSTNPSYANVKDSNEDLPPVSPHRSAGNKPINPHPVLPPMNKGHTQVTPIGSRTSSPMPEVDVTTLCRKYQEPDANGCIVLDVVAQDHDSRFFKLGQHSIKVSWSLQELRKELKKTFPRLQNGKFVYLNATMTDRIPKKREEFVRMRDMGNGPVIVRLT
ncbi:Fibrocystin-L [Branchiostoma belcheri]|nr:Fibrocystin-L [Branchiostoma belcheri]